MGVQGRNSYELGRGNKDSPRLREGDCKSHHMKGPLAQALRSQGTGVLGSPQALVFNKARVYPLMVYPPVHPASSPSFPQAQGTTELPGPLQGRVWATAQAVAAGPSSVHHKPVSEGLPGMEPVACPCGLAVTIAGPERKKA